MQVSEGAKFDSIILAGGFGKRLSPLTDTVPKPMLSISGESAFSRNVRRLRDNGFMNTAVTTMYLPEKIEGFTHEKGSIEYIRETKPLGSAGAISRLKDRLADCVIVISGDAIFDYDLKETKEEFLKSGCDAAMVLTRCEDAGEFGSVCVHKGKICGFCEKPSVRDTLSDKINTGIYFISKKAVELIPEDTFCDFARDLFPTMLRKGLSIAGLEPKGHWFDIGSFGEYHRCNLWVSGGKNCIGNHVSIHPEARVEQSVILDNCTVGNSILRGCVVAENVCIGNDCIVPSGCVIGAGAELRDNTVLSPGTVVNTGETVAGEAPIEYFPKAKRSLLLDDDAIIAQDTDEGYFVRLGRTLGGNGPIITFAEGNGMTLPHACEIACGVSETGVGCTVISGGSAAFASFAANEYGTPTAYISENDGHTEIKLFSKTGMPFSREALIKLSSAQITVSNTPGSVYLLPHGALIKRYMSIIKSEITLPTQIGISQEPSNRLLYEICDEFGIKTDKTDAVFTLSQDGERASAVLSDGREISYWQLLAICCIEGEKSGILLPNETPNAVEQILKRHSIDVAFYGDSESEERTLAESERLPRDGVLLSLTAAGLAEKKGVPLGEMLDRLPPFVISTHTVYADRHKMASVISRLRDKNAFGRCAAFEFGDGRVNVIACASGRFRLIAEAVDFETAEEISLRAADLLEKEK